MGREYSAEITAAIQSFLEEDDWKFLFDEEKGLFELLVGTHQKIGDLAIVIDVKKDEYLVYTLCQIKPESEETKAEMMDFLIGVNYGLKNGNFELDRKTGEFRYKTYVSCDHQIPGSKIIRNSIRCALAMYTHYGPGIVEICDGLSTSRQALYHCESSGSRSHSDSADDPRLQRLISQILQSRAGAASALEHSEESEECKEMVDTDLFGFGEEE